MLALTHASVQEKGRVLIFAVAKVKTRATP